MDRGSVALQLGKSGSAKELPYARSDVIMGENEKAPPRMTAAPGQPAIKEKESREKAPVDRGAHNRPFPAATYTPAIART